MHQEATLDIKQSVRDPILYISFWVYFCYWFAEKRLFISLHLTLTTQNYHLLLLFSSGVAIISTQL